MDNNAQCPVIFEEWRNINYGKVTPNMYEVSNCGRVRNIKSKVIIKPYITNSNYLEYHLFKDKNIVLLRQIDIKALQHID